MEEPRIEFRQQEKSAQAGLDKARHNFLSVWATIGGLLLFVVAGYVCSVLSVPISIVIWTAIFVFCLRGPVDFFEHRGFSRMISTGFAFALMFVVFVLILILMFSPVFGIGDQFTSLLQSVPTYITNITAWANELYAQYSNILANDTIQGYVNDVFTGLATWVSDLAKTSASGVVAIGSGVVNICVAIGFALVVAFWILMELPALGRETMRLAGPKHRETMQMLHLTFTRVMGGYIKGTLIQCSVIGVGSAIIFGLLGIPNFAALGIISGLLNIIPIIGPWLGGALAAVVGVFVSPLVAVLSIVLTGALSQVVYTFISPKIMADSVDIHPALTILALVFGSAIGGAMSGLMGSLVGMLAAIPAVAVAKSIFVYYFEKRTGRHLVSEDGVFFQGTRSEDGELNPMADATSPHPDVRAAAKRAAEIRKARAEKKIQNKKED